jgi:hypothetical protein
MPISCCLQPPGAQYILMTGLAIQANDVAPAGLSQDPHAIRPQGGDSGLDDMQASSQINLRGS